MRGKTWRSPVINDGSFISVISDPGPFTITAARLCLQLFGISLLAVHGRTLKENKTATGVARWEAIRAIVDSLSIPVIANGGCEFPSDIQECIDATKAAGVMSSEGEKKNKQPTNLLASFY